MNEEEKRLKRIAMELFGVDEKQAEELVQLRKEAERIKKGYPLNCHSEEMQIRTLRMEFWEAG